MTQSANLFDQNWDAIAHYLETQGHSLDRDFEIRQLSGGVANYNFLISMDGKMAVLRRPPDGPLPPGSNDVAREYKVLSHLNAAFPPAPKGLLFCDDETVIGVPFCISEFRDGVCISRELPESLIDREDVGNALSELLVDTLTRLHLVDVDAVGLSGLGKYDGFLERQISGWFRRGERVLNEVQMQKLVSVRDWLSANLPEQAASGTLVHNDFKLDNMLVDPQSLEISGLVDWDICTFGDPIYELMILLAYWGGHDDPFVYAFQCRMPCYAKGWWPRDQVIDCYLEIMNRKICERDLCFYWWLSQYRTVIVYAQLDKLFKRQGNSAYFSKEEAARIAPFYDELLSFIDDNKDNIPEFLRR
ncbi:MAG: phosphotransferase family protein [Candidatus Thiodiazotropha sp.]